VDAVGVNDNFFALGGHSLVAIQAITRVRELFNVELLLRTFFESPTVAQLAAAIEADPVGREKAAKIAGILARLDGLPDEELERALNHVIERHDSLRTTFPTSNGQPSSVIHSTRPITLPVVDIPASSGQDQLARVRRLAGEQLRQPFDLAVGSLIRGSIFRL